MPLLGSIFHFPAVVNNYFYQKCLQSDPKLIPGLHQIIKIYSKKNVFRNPPVPLASRRVEFTTNNKASKPPKPPKQASRGRVYPPPTPSRTVRLAGFVAQLAYSGPAWTSKKRWKNVYLLLMGPFGSDIRRYNLHYMCHSTSICHFWHHFLHFPAIVFRYFYENCLQSDAKLTP